MTVVMKTQARWALMERTDVFYVGISLIVMGTVLVVSSFLALGFTGTFLGKFQVVSDSKCRVQQYTYLYEKYPYGPDGPHVN